MPKNDAVAHIVFHAHIMAGILALNQAIFRSF